jgi:ATP-dependent DNA ligase
LDGALESWAVPKGPSPDTADKRLAMHVEPHPLEYAEFEGVIPDGQYGAGPSICWDKGVWIEIPGDKHGIEHGKLLFELRGYKLRGRWTLVHTPKRGEKHWLLIKERQLRIILAVPFTAATIDVSLELFDLELQSLIVASQTFVDVVLLFFDCQSLSNHRVTRLDIVRQLLCFRHAFVVVIAQKNARRTNTLR